jgi:transcription elongation factor GreA
MTSSDLIPFTQAKFDELKAQKATLQKEEGEVKIRLKTAREMGDLSENGAYRYAKFELGNIRRQLRTINDQLSRGYVPQTAASFGQSSSTVVFGSTVVLEGPKGTVTYQIISEYESDPSQGKLGMTSPLGKQLMGKIKGQQLAIVTPKGDVTYHISEVR